MWECPICSNIEEDANICSKCGLDRRNNYVNSRTVCSIDKVDVDSWKRAEKLQKYDDLSADYELLKAEISSLKDELLQLKKDYINIKKDLDNLKTHNIQAIQDEPNIVSVKEKRKETYSNGEWYEGEFLNGQRHGEGVYHYPSGAYYEGQFVNGKRQGNGTFYYANKDRYTGGFYDDFCDGRGIYYFSDGEIKTGRWEKGVFKG